MKNKLRILVFPGWFPGQVHPLNAIFTKKHLDIISQDHFIAVAYTEKQTSTQQLHLDYDFQYPICRTYYKNSRFKLVSLIRKLSKVIEAQKSAIKQLKEVDIIHIHVVEIEAIIPWFYSLFFNKPIFVSEHSTHYLEHQNEHLLIKIVRRLIYSRCKGISAVSESLKIAIQNRGYRNSNFPVIHNVVDFDTFKVREVEKGGDNIDKVRFLHVSRLDESAKNVIGILRTFDKLSKDFPNIELHIVGGDGITEFPSQVYSKQLKSSNHIFFKGLKYGTLMAEEYQSADYLVMFSSYETQAVVVLEALACGKPVIATKLPCLNEYLHKGNSIQVSPKDENELFDAMKSCILGKTHFLDSSVISSEIMLKFSKQSIKERFNQFYCTGLSLND